MALQAAVKLVSRHGEGVNNAALAAPEQAHLLPATVANDTSPVLQPASVPAAATDNEPDSGRAEMRARLKASAERWTVRAVALLAGIALWYYASATGLDFYVRFDNVPGPFRVGAALLQHLQQSSFYMHIAVSF